jgi:hypothetical protein
LVGDTLLLPLAFYLEHKDYHPVDASGAQPPEGPPSPDGANASLQTSGSGPTTAKE